MKVRQVARVTAAIGLLLTASCSSGDGRDVASSTAASSTTTTAALSERAGPCVDAIKATAREVTDFGITAVSKMTVSRDGLDGTLLKSARDRIQTTRDLCAAAMPECPKAADAALDVYTAMLDGLVSLQADPTQLPTFDGGLPGVTCAGTAITNAVPAPSSTTTTVAADPAQRVRDLMSRVSPDSAKLADLNARMAAALQLVIDDPSNTGPVQLVAGELRDLYAGAAFLWNDAVPEIEAIGDPYRAPLLELKRANELRIDAAKELATCGCDFSRMIDLSTAGSDEAGQALITLKAILPS